MKSTQSAKQAASAEEEKCGIWLDTKELKEKKQQKQRTRPISELLNPLARCAGFGFTVSFTQTKLIMPATTQSSIAAFFSPKPRDCSSSAAHAGTSHTGTKRKHGMTSDPSINSIIQTSEVNQQNCDGLSDKKEPRFLHLICGDEPEEPPGKRRRITKHTDKENVLETQKYWCKREYPNKSAAETRTFFDGQSQNHDPLMLRKPSGETRDHFHLKTRVKESILTSRPVNENHQPHATSKHQEQAWRKTNASPMKRMGKENSWPSSPIKSAPSSPFRLVSSPAKCSLNDKRTFSPKKSSEEHAGAETAGETLAALFTQDSEGFCVIAHRDQHSKSPIKHRRGSSAHTDNSQSVASLETEEDESDQEMLFTQDSEGNVVIKH